MKILKILFAVLLVALIGGALIGAKALQFMTMAETGEAMEESATAVSVAQVVTRPWETTIPAIGSVAPVQGITVRTEVGGVVEEIAFRAGAQVEQGELLVALDDSVEQANLAQAEAELDLAERNRRRSEDLYESRSIPAADLDAARSRVAAVEAQVASLRATLAKKEIRAPFAGTLGIRRISLGQYLTPGDAVVLLQALDEVFVEFSVPQREFGRLEEGLLVRATTDAYPDRVLEGRLTAINAQIDVATRNVRVQATFENRDDLLRAGMFVSAAVVLPEIREARMIPASAVMYAPYGNSVYIVEEGEDEALTVRRQFVRLGGSQGDYVEILEGVEPDERIVSAGAFKLRPGAAIRISDVGTREPSFTPDPADA
ncbi:MAG: efflux RND transporter periplasmic adaptor subunit [Opitutales bacterium]